MHAYSHVLGNVLKAIRYRRKHWWQVSLRPSLNGLSTGVVWANLDFELELNLRASTLEVRTAAGTQHAIAIDGQPAAALGASVKQELIDRGVDPTLLPDAGSADAHPDYAPEQARAMAVGLSAIATAMTALRAAIKEETSPIQLWPHHFDLSMIWLPGEKIDGEDPDDEEQSDKQMNFGFAFGDSSVPEPYFYVTAYPLPAAMRETRLPAGSTWHSEGFEGAMVTYAHVAASDDPQAYLMTLWRDLLASGRQHLVGN